jgi:hypothetical protein
MKNNDDEKTNGEKRAEMKDHLDMIKNQAKELGDAAHFLHGSASRTEEIIASAPKKLIPEIYSFFMPRISQINGPNGILKSSFNGIDGAYSAMASANSSMSSVSGEFYKVVQIQMEAGSDWAVAIVNKEVNEEKIQFIMNKLARWPDLRDMFRNAVDEYEKRTDPVNSAGRLRNAIVALKDKLSGLLTREEGHEVNTWLGVLNKVGEVFGLAEAKTRGIISEASKRLKDVYGDLSGVTKDQNNAKLDFKKGIEAIFGYLQVLNWEEVNKR